MQATPAGPIWTIIVAAGSGSRFGGAVPKQFVTVAGRRIVDWSVAVAAAVSDGVVVVLPPSGDYPDLAVCEAAELRTVPGGNSRSASVRAGLASVPDDVAIVLVHDAARPLATRDVFARVIAAVVDGADASIPVVPVVDTLRHVDGRPRDRSDLVAVQTPQGFRRAVLERAHADAEVSTDDANLVTALGGQVVTVPGDRWNLKVTDPTDDLVAAALLESRT